MQVNGTATTRAQFCIGEILTLVCRHDTTVYGWEVPQVIAGRDLQVTRGFPINSVNNFNATIVSDTECTLVFEASMDLNGSVIRCL